MTRENDVILNVATLLHSNICFVESAIGEVDLHIVIFGHVNLGHASDKIT